jgi:hypothetical protein
MSELQQIHGLIGRTRRRLRIQAALEWATTALVPAIGLGLGTLWLWRLELVSDALAVMLGSIPCALVLGSALVAATRRLPAYQMASRLDRASGLSDRLGSACEFAESLRQRSPLHPETLALMHAAIADGVRAVPQANVKAAAPFSLPGDLRTALAFCAMGVVVVMLAFGPSGDASPGSRSLAQARGFGADPDEPAGLDEDDLAVPRDVVLTLREIATQTGDPELHQLAVELEALLEQAQKGLLGKEALLAKMAALEHTYLESTKGDTEATLQDLQASARELQKEPLTRSLGAALGAGDLAGAQKELERLADKLDKHELSKAQERRLAEVLEKTAQKHEQKQKDQEAEADKKLAKKREDVRRLEKKAQEKPKDKDAQRRLHKERRELEELERDRQENREQAQKRRLERLHRDMKRSAESLRNQRAEASHRMRDMSEDTKGIEDEIRKIENRKRVASQLGDIKDSIRRARPKKGQGQDGQKRARAQRIREWEERAGGRRGDWRVWKPGQSAGRAGTSQSGESDPSGSPAPGVGDGHDPSALGDPTDLAAKTRDEELTGRQGAGPSRRETILTSARKGFATTAYQKVFAEYRKIVEDVMSREKVPVGYKYYVKRYFQRIKPHRME